MNIVIQKFGGTSVATEESRNYVIQKIIDIKLKGKKPVVVVSAMGRKGDPYATDTLLQITNTMDLHECLREKDLLMSCGEIISAVVLVTTLLQKGYKAMAFTGGQAGIITDEQFGQAHVLEVNSQTLQKVINEGFIPIVAGFQGISKNGNITTLGRGGSDTTAALLGEALKAESIEIYTDVDGIMTTDPRIYPKAQRIHCLSYNEVFQMADNGARVIHPRAVQIARRANIPLYIKNTFNDSKGTCILHCPVSPIPLVTAIAYRSQRVQISIIDEKVEDEIFFALLAKEGVSIDIINIFPERKVFTIDEECLPLVFALLEKQKINFSYIKDCCKITMIGEGMTGVPGVMAKILRCLKNEHVEILQTADSLMTIACLIYNKDLSRAIKVLHQEFQL